MPLDLCGAGIACRHSVIAVRSRVEMLRFIRTGPCVIGVFCADVYATIMHYYVQRDNRNTLGIDCLGGFGQVLAAGLLAR